MNQVLHSRKSDEWATPQDLYDALHTEFRFTLDPCATHENHKCTCYRTIEDDGLACDWSGHRAFVNPPHSQLKRWIKKCKEESDKGCTVVMLIPARTDTKAFHEFIWDARTHHPRTGVELRLLPGRLKFGNAENSAPFPSAIVVFRPGK